MENLITETNEHLKEIISNLQNIGREYEDKLNRNTEMIEIEKEKANKYRHDFAIAKGKVDKMNIDIQGFESDYNNLVEKFKDDELSNILVAANREISAKIDERKKLILKDQIAMNSLVQKAESVKTKLVKLYAEKKVLEYCYQQIVDAYDYYSTELSKIINYSNTHRDFLCECYQEPKVEEVKEEPKVEEKKEVKKEEKVTEVPEEKEEKEEVIEEVIPVKTDIVSDDEYQDVLASVDDLDTEDEESDDKQVIEADQDDDIIYLDNLDLDDEDDEDEDEGDIDIDTDYKGMDLRDKMNDLETTDNEDILNYLEISDEDLDKLINQSDDLED